MTALFNLAKMTSGTTGTGTLTLGTAVSGYLTFALAGVTNGQVVSYAIEDPNGSPSAHEIGFGTYSSAGPTLTRTVTASTNGGAALNLTGNEWVYITPRAEDITNKTGDTLTGALNFATQVVLASAGTVAIGAAASNYLQITGTTTITAFDTIASGSMRILQFAGSLTLTHNATSLILPGGANITTAAGDCGVFNSEGSGNWRCIIYTRASGAPLATIATETAAINYSATQTIASASTTDIGAATSNSIIISGTTTITALGTIAAGPERQVTFSGALILTHNATSLILPGGANITTAAGDCATFVSLGSGNWRCTKYWPAAGVNGGIALLATLTASSSASLVDTTSLTSSYDLYMLTFENIRPATDDVQLKMRVSTNGGSTYQSTTYSNNSQLLGVGTNSGSFSSTDCIALSNSTSLTGTLSNTAGYGLSGVLYFPVPSGAAQRKVVTGNIAMNGYSFGSNSGVWPVILSGFYDTNTAINAIQFTMSTGNIASGKIRIYGVKTS